jgi:hypothetical protein
MAGKFKFVFFHPFKKLKTTSSPTTTSSNNKIMDVNRIIVEMRIMEDK